ncbi:hypothetical protein DM02DRAFT_564465 [Periconia macrospinosa]|uniref:Exonuclease domain-containing protein n=1 Tax=Periconia macrospinosa TaxID=97972 RepID=A0A2V1DN15_9PLEO|nr:hypothetical protein DM02DRAFT_564465 [Periconia macrospinosa]
MAKRKRDIPDEEPADFGLGATLAHLKDSESASSQMKKAADGDNEGWTVVGPKKRRKAEGEAQHEEELPAGTHNTHKTNRQSDREARRKERKLERNYPAIEHAPQARIQSFVKITDLQALALYILAEGVAPQWVAIRNRASIRQVVMLMVPGLEMGMFSGKIPLEGDAHAVDAPKDTDHDGEKPRRLTVDPDDYYPIKLKSHKMPAALQPLSEVFPHVWPIRAQADYRGDTLLRLHSPIHTMLMSQIPKSREEKQLKKSKDHKGPLPQSAKHWENKRTPITEYIASLAEQQENEYVVHPAWFSNPEAKASAYESRKTARQTSEHGWVDTNVTSLEDGEVIADEMESGSVTAGRHVLAVDCEMCKSEQDEHVLTRISITDWDGTVVMDKLVKPDVPIKDYLTQFSGITPAMLQDVTTTLRDIQQELLELVTPRTILVGHSLNSDLNALKLTHPFLIDTGILFPHVRGPPYKQSLKWLAQKFLQKEIQKGVDGHNSIEDARTALNLVKQKCERGPAWGTNETNAESIFKRLGRANRPQSGGGTRAGAVVDWGEPNRGHGAQAQMSIACQSDEEVAQGIQHALSGQSQNKEGISEKVDFVWGRLRELELARGWWDDGRTSEDVEAMRQSALARLGLGENAKDKREAEEVSGAALGHVVSQTVDRIAQIYDALPRCTALIVYSGTGDPREVRRLQNMHQTYRREFATKNWDKLSVQWTDTEVQALSTACKRARKGIGFMVVK